jgi:hypothetical protein
MSRPLKAVIFISGLLENGNPAISIRILASSSLTVSLHFQLSLSLFFGLVMVCYCLKLLQKLTINLWKDMAECMGQVLDVIAVTGRHF